MSAKVTDWEDRAAECLTLVPMTDMPQQICLNRYASSLCYRELCAQNKV